MILQESIENNLLFSLFGTPVLAWVIFAIVVVLLLAVDLGIFHKQQREISVSESLKLSAGYILIASLFGVGVWSCFGIQAGVNYFTGFLVEKSLSMDNIFVISLIFNYFSIPRMYQHRVLFWGILGVIILRGLMIALGAVLIARFSWIMYLFSAFLLVTGLKMLITKNEPLDLEKNPMMAWIRKHLNITTTLHQAHFFIKAPSLKNSNKMVYWVTPLFVTLVFIETADLVFAVDSVPAVFAITSDPFIVYTSNIFAILGLRSLYFALAAMIHRFHYLKYALALILIFIGSKIFLKEIALEIPSAVSLAITLGLLLGGVLYSLNKTKKSS